MQFLVISNRGRLESVATRLRKEEHTVTYEGRGRFGTIRKGTTIVADCPGDGARLDEYRNLGYVVLGTSRFTDTVGLSGEYRRTLMRMADIAEIPTSHGLEAWYNGNAFILGTTAVFVEDTHFLSGDLGLEVDCASITYAYWKRFRPSVFKETVGRLHRLLRKASHVGAVGFRHGELYCGVEPDTLSCIAHMFRGNFGKFLHDVARGRSVKVDSPGACACSVLVSYPPYPYHDERVELGSDTETVTRFDERVGAICGYIVGNGETIGSARAAMFDRVFRWRAPAQWRVDAGAKAQQVIPTLFREEMQNARRDRFPDSSAPLSVAGVGDRQSAEVDTVGIPTGRDVVRYAEQLTLPYETDETTHGYSINTSNDTCAVGE